MFTGRMIGQGHPLGPREVMVRWLGIAGIGRDRLAELATLLGPDERERAARFRFADDAEAYRAAHIVKRCALSAAAGPAAPAPADWRFVETELGKPEIAAAGGDDPPLRFSISHTRGLVAVAVARRSAIGIDVERIDRDLDDGVAATIFSAFERRQIEARPQAQRTRAAIGLWTLKEAALKALGTGLATPPAALEFVLEPPAMHASTLEGCDPSGWRFLRLHPSADHMLALALRDRASGELRIDARAADLDGLA